MTTAETSTSGATENYSTDSIFSPSERLETVLKRRAARKSLIEFTKYTFPQYHVAAHHALIASKLEAVMAGEIDRLMLLVAPRHGKSELASKRFPAFYLGHKPDKQFIAVSATADLATDFGRDVRNTLASSQYQALFNTTLAEDSQAKGKWHTSEGGVYYSIGVGGNIFGRGGDVILIDDPFASMVHAQSEIERKNVWDWYQGTIYNRLQPGGAIVLINHRVHEDDLSGKLIEQQTAGGDQWDIVELPATPEKPLWPEWYDSEALERIKRNTLPRYWSALYEQNPTPDEGTYFQSDWLKPYIKAPDKATLRIYGASDYAVTPDGGDYTVHIVVGMDPKENIYVLDLWRAQTDSSVWVETFCELVKAHKPIGWAEEGGQIRAGVGPFLERTMRKRKAFVARHSFPTKGDKAIRAQSIRGRMAVDGLYVPMDAPWYPSFESELLAFPAGTHDDQVDALGLIGQLLDQMVPGRKPKPDAPLKDRWDKAFEKVDSEDWKTL